MPTCKALVVSDVHGRLRDLRWILQHETADALFVLGDSLPDLDRALSQLDAPLGYPVYRVCGNCDVGYADPIEGLTPLGGVLFFYTHGHRYWVKTSYDELLESARNRGADVVLFGHTHQRVLRRTRGLPTLFNPGALYNGIYGVITITDGVCQFGWKRVP